MEITEAEYAALHDDSLPSTTAPKVSVPFSEARKWTDATGKFSTSAVLVACDSATAILKKPDGKELVLPVTKLSEDDKSYLTAVSTPDKEGHHVILGKVVGVSDGDTISVLDAARHSHKVRLEGIDAPEGHQAYGTQAKKALSDKVFGKTVRVDWKKLDKYGRTLGWVFIDDHKINRELIAEGYAWHYKEYNSDSDLARAERDARLIRAGLWNDPRHIAPWEFRRGLTDNAVVASSEPGLKAQPPPADETVFVTATGTKYHSAGCRHLAKSRIPIALSEAQVRFGPCSNCRSERATSNASAASTPLDSLYGSANNDEVQVYVTRTGAKYHRGSCRHLSKSKIPIALSDARARYSPCSVCGPP